MPEQGRLIALDGTGGAAMVSAAKRLQRLYRQARSPAPGVSTWDASGIFFEIREGARGIPGASPRTLMLLYASDLAFRLRWQIRPALAAGETVIAAPYLETAIALGRSAGIPRTWLKDLFAFAPAADAQYRVAETRVPASRKPQPSDSFVEFGLMQLRITEGRWNTDDMRRDFLTHLAGLEAKGKCRVVTDSMQAIAAAK